MTGHGFTADPIRANLHDPYAPVRCSPHRQRHYDKLGNRVYRGLSGPVWAERLKAAGWPDVAAEEMAGFLVGERSEPPEYRPDYWERRQDLRDRKDVE